MKVSVRKLGPIEEADFDLKPLTVLIGPNNAGKTWLAYALAGILGPFGSREYIQAYADGKVTRTYEPLDTAIQRLLDEGSANIDLRQFAENYGERYFNDIAQRARSWMPRFLSTQLAHFDDMEISLNLAEEKEDFLQRIVDYSWINSVARSALTIRKSSGQNKVFAFTETQGTESQEKLLEEKIPLEEVRKRLVNFVATALTRSLYPNIRIFPTERTTRIASRFPGRRPERIQLVINDRAREALSILEEELGIVEPIDRKRIAREMTIPESSFMTMLTTIFRSGSRERDEREAQTRNKPQIRRYIELAEVLEQEILTGNVSLSTDEPDPGREVLFQPTQGVHLEIPIASSMVKELSPLVLYLRHLAEPGELLVIDEPEMNLHPAAQVQIIEFLAMLVNAGLRVLITTHSTYIVDHLMNLMDAYKHPQQDEIMETFLLEQKEAFIAQEHVSVNLVEGDGKVKNVLSPEGTIDWSTFSDVTAFVGRLHFELGG